MRVLAGLFLAMSLVTAGCATSPQHGAAAATRSQATLSGDAVHPDATQGWVRTELYFGLGLADGHDGVDEAAWRTFLDKEVTPRFPSGLTVVDAYGQWQGVNQAKPERLRSKIVILLYADTPTQRASIDAIRSAWKAKTGDQSVLRVTQPADVSF
ncbi:hypothetical protein BJI69_12365 [Luteibacter rhizovicinus DSM 16549]|uniref:Uncharacterized protein n=1 Tax=Luteibacter rhizovicinus DSM 16549 TaxID=1440763 RepID=A0A0G9H7D0_9GAMM|nr:DUF3574 domain-containing protein [Luteibacter rhizovicinus]APG04612.1 hypothetical protein BJI69_12365 [Luteibacter rhizovicinus DSM 16549]KLD65386.1 hypothetical protein Y883_16525 [Luteibacter rhizovicinus DSM 16549]